MQKVLNLYKKLGETPLERLGRLREENPEYKDETLTYAGRLDPMAEGVLLVLAGEENKKRVDYLGLPKEYEFEILWGFETDTFDILGLPSVSKIRNPNFEIRNNLPTDTKTLNSKLPKILKNYEGKIIQKYPPYSSKPVSGKPLFQWAREGKISEIEIPEREVEVYSLEILDNYSIRKPEPEKQIIEKISLVKGDFRQKEVVENWKKALKENPKDSFAISCLKVSASSGFYVRSLVNDLGKELSCGATTFKIVRTRVGNWQIKNSI